MVAVVNNLYAFSQFGKDKYMSSFTLRQTKMQLWCRPLGIQFKVLKEQRDIMAVNNSILKTATLATYFVSSPLLFTLTCNHENYTTNMSKSIQHMRT